MKKLSKGERTVWRLGTALALLIPLACIVIAELTGWTPTDIFIASHAVKYVCVIGVAVMLAVVAFIWLASYITNRYL